MLSFLMGFIPAKGEYIHSMDEYRIDSHKLIFHVDRVASWLKGADIYPIYMEVSPKWGVWA